MSDRLGWLLFCAVLPCALLGGLTAVAVALGFAKQLRSSTGTSADDPRGGSG